MLKKYPYIIVLCIALLGTLKLSGQMTMPDYVCIGQTKHYSVIQSKLPNSTYIWWIDKVRQAETSNSIDITWNNEGTFLLEVQELTMWGCVGPARSGEVFVFPLPDQPVADVKQPTCIIKTGTIRITSPVETGLTYSINGTDYSNTTGVFPSLASGTYSVTAMNENGCVSPVTTVTINAPPSIDESFSKELSYYNGYNISCYGLSDGFINVTTKNESTSYAFEWSGPNGFRANTQNISGLSAGNYVMLIIDKNLCTAIDTSVLIQPGMMLLSFVMSQPFCPDTRDGEIQLQVSGGVPEYDYLWSDNSTANYLTGISAGNYQVITKDMNGCTVKGSVNLRPVNDACIKPPEAFSPNGDLINDVWLIENIEKYPEAEVTIYNRWGQVIWRSERGYPIPWDGRSNGIPMPIDSYHYVIDLHNGNKPIAGFVTLVK
jgi:gliding motility-associated-like protein